MRSVALAMTVALAAGQGAMEVPAGGGRCKSECRASLCHGFKCDRCSTGFLRSDYCVYPGNATFETKSFQDKGSYFWEALAKDQQHAEYPNVLGIITESARTTFYNMGDEMPAGRKKTIHGVGAVCRFKIENNAESPYTGLFEPGQQEGFIRLGSAVNYNNGGLTPGLGIKFPRTGRASGNYVALHSLDFGQSWNFFASNLSNHIPPPTSDPKQKIIVKKFNQASNCPTQVGLSDMARYSQNGNKHDSPKFPFKLFLVPSKEVQTPDEKKTVDVVNAEMNAFPVGTTLYTVYACGKAAGVKEELKPTDGGIEQSCGEPLKLGAMVTTTKCISSAYGDKAFQIRHQPVEEDWQADSSILEQAQYDASQACGWTGDAGKIPTSPHLHPPVTPPGGCAKSSLDGMLEGDVTIV